jgi:hypothetical protein
MKSIRFRLLLQFFHQWKMISYFMSGEEQTKTSEESLKKLFMETKFKSRAACHRIKALETQLANIHSEKYQREMISLRAQKQINDELRQSQSRAETAEALVRQLEKQLMGEGGGGGEGGGISETKSSGSRLGTSTITVNDIVSAKETEISTRGKSTPVFPHSLITRPHTPKQTNDLLTPLPDTPNLHQTEVLSCHSQSSTDAGRYHGFLLLLSFSIRSLAKKRLLRAFYLWRSQTQPVKENFVAICSSSPPTGVPVDHDDGDEISLSTLKSSINETKELTEMTKRYNDLKKQSSAYKEQVKAHWTKTEAYIKKVKDMVTEEREKRTALKSDLKKLSRENDSLMNQLSEAKSSQESSKRNSRNLNEHSRSVGTPQSSPYPRQSTRDQPSEVLSSPDLKPNLFSSPDLKNFPPSHHQVIQINDSNAPTEPLDHQSSVIELAVQHNSQPITLTTQIIEEDAMWLPQGALIPEAGIKLSEGQTEEGIHDNLQTQSHTEVTSQEQINVIIATPQNETYDQTYSQSYDGDYYYQWETLYAEAQQQLAAEMSAKEESYRTCESLREQLESLQSQAQRERELYEQLIQLITPQNGAQSVLEQQRSITPPATTTLTTAEMSRMRRRQSLPNLGGLVKNRTLTNATKTQESNRTIGFSSKLFRVVSQSEGDTSDEEEPTLLPDLPDLDLTLALDEYAQQDNEIRHLTPIQIENPAIEEAMTAKIRPSSSHSGQNSDKTITQSSKLNQILSTSSVQFPHSVSSEDEQFDSIWHLLNNESGGSAGAAGDGSTNVRVAIRMRPLNSRELDLQSHKCIEMIGGTEIVVMDPEAMQEHRFNFDFCFDTTAPDSDPSAGYCPDLQSFMNLFLGSQQITFEKIGVEVLANAWRGYNASLFACKDGPLHSPSLSLFCLSVSSLHLSTDGQTGSGKSYSMMGSESSPGIIPRICRALFYLIKRYNLEHGFMEDVPPEERPYTVEASYLEIYNEV